MSLETVRLEVERRVAEAMIPVIFERIKRVHKKKAWRYCDCSWCVKKRRCHSYLQYSPFGMRHQGRREWREAGIKEWRAILSSEADKVEG